jgi:uncharacterized membrane protein YedE/YeeE
MIDWTNFTPLASAAGGALIGLSAALLILLSGRIAGISGILGGLLAWPKGDTGWRLAFLSGLLAAPLVVALFAPLPAVRVDAGSPTLVAAGLLVGIGTRYGAGCTSGHGVCGLSRRSPRSLAATAAFMLAGFATVFVVRHLLA